MTYKNLAEILYLIEKNDFLYMWQLRSFLKNYKPYLLDQFYYSADMLKTFLMRRRGIVNV